MIADASEAPPESLEQLLQEALREARTAWPELNAPADAFVRQLAKGATEQRAWPQPLFAADVYLACACALKVEGALEAFDRQHLPLLQKTARRVALENSEDVVQAFRVRLLLGGPDKPPMIADFAGRGTMKSWLRLAITHASLKSKRDRSPSAPEALIDRLPESEDDPELAIIKRNYKPHFTRALKDAIGDLEPRSRRLLAQHYIDGVEVNHLAQLHGVHRTTASRWLSEARSQLLSRTRTRLGEALRVSSAECDSILRVVDQELDESIRGVFSEDS